MPVRYGRVPGRTTSGGRSLRRYFLFLYCVPHPVWRTCEVTHLYSCLQKGQGSRRGIVLWEEMTTGRQYDGMEMARVTGGSTLAPWLRRCCLVVKFRWVVPRHSSRVAILDLDFLGQNSMGCQCVFRDWNVLDAILVRWKAPSRMRHNFGGGRLYAVSGRDCTGEKFEQGILAGSFK